MSSRSENTYSSSSSHGKKKIQSTADKYASLFDNQWINTQRSAIRTKLHDSRSYDPVYSWNGQSADMSSSRLDTTNLPHTYRPIGLSGKTVIPLEDHNTLEAMNVPEPDYKTSYYPLTSLQLDVGMSPSMHSAIPIKEEAKRQNKVVVVDKESIFSHGVLQAPTFKLVDVPKGLSSGGHNCDQKLLTPSQRLEVQEYERRKQIADQYFRRAEQSRGTLNKQLHGPVYKRGITGLDSSHNECSEVYGKDALRDRQQAEHRAIVHQQRYENLAKKTSSMLTNGNILVPESIDTSHVKTEKLYQSKGACHGLSFEETHKRLFYRVSERPSDYRQRQLRQHDQGGKSYNIVTHTAIEAPGSALPYERKVTMSDKLMMHPSQTSLEGSRNLQGSLRPY